MTANEFLRLKELVESLKRERDRLDGQIGMMNQQIKKEFGCKTPEEEVALVKKSEKEADEKNVKADKALAEFEQEYGHKL